MNLDVQVHGSVEPEFEPVYDAFVENFTHRHELGAACAVFLHGRKVVDLCAGVRDRRSEEPWQSDTMTIVHSTSKGLSAMGANVRFLDGHASQIAGKFRRMPHQIDKERQGGL